MITKISALNSCIDQVVSLQLTVVSIRDQKHMQFIIANDSSGTLQLFVSKKTVANHDQIGKMLTGSTFTATGKIVSSTQSKTNGIEMQVDSVVIESVAMPAPISADSDIDLRFTYRVVDLKTNKNQKMLKARSIFENACREFLTTMDMTEIHTPKLMGSASESGSQVFKVEYFDTYAYLAQSPQFYKQMAIASGLNGVFEIGPIFRAEESRSSRHMTEFVGLDVEIPWVTDLNEVMNIEEAMLSCAFAKVSKTLGQAIRQEFGFEVNEPNFFKKMTLVEAKNCLAESGVKVQPNGDLTDEQEKKLYEVLGYEMIFVTDYPINKRPFYHKYDVTTGTTKSFDLIYRGIEITTGALREHDLITLSKQATDKGVDLKSIDTYLDNFRYGCPPHGGFGIGIERIIAKMFNFSSVKEAAFIPRDPERLTP